MICLSGPESQCLALHRASSAALHLNSGSSPISGSIARPIPIPNPCGAAMTTCIPVSMANAQERGLEGGCSIRWHGWPRAAGCR